VALLQNDRGRSAEAEPLLREVLRTRQAQNAPALDIARAKGNLGTALMDLRRYDEAEALLREAERALDQASAPPELVFGVHNNLGVLFLSTSRPDLARETFGEAREALLKTVGPNAPATIMATGNLAAATRQLGQLDEAVKLMTDLLPTARRVAGDTHPAVLTGLINLAAAWNALGTPQRTIEALPDALAAARTSLGPAHPTTVLAMMALGEAYLNTRQPAKASPLLTDAVAGFRAAGTADTADGLQARTLLVRSSIGGSRPAEAIADMRRIVTRTEALRGTDSLPALLARQLLGFVLLSANETAAAAPLIQSTLAALGNFPDDPGARIGMIEGLQALSSVRGREGRIDDELQLLEQAVAKADAEGPGLRELANRLKAELANAYVAFRRAPERAEALLRAAIEGLGAALGPSHPDAIAPLFDLWSLKRRTAPKRETGAIEVTLAPRLRAAAETADASPDTLARLSVLLRLAIAPGIRDLPASVAFAERATATGSTNFSLWMALGEARLANKQRAGAAAAFERAIALMPPGPARAQVEGRIRELKR
jgi:tetratricopeptide (TPR) repeat protein